jgi:hypothetical protein
MRMALMSTLIFLKIKREIPVICYGVLNPCGPTPRLWLKKELKANIAG